MPSFPDPPGLSILVFVLIQILQCMCQARAGTTSPLPPWLSRWTVIDMSSGNPLSGNDLRSLFFKTQIICPYGKPANFGGDGGDDDKHLHFK